MRSIRFLLAGVGIACVLGQELRAAETTLLFQGFEPGDAWTIQAGSNGISTATGAADTPASQRILAGSASWQVNLGSNSLVLADTSLAALTGRLVRIRLSSTSGTAANGADATDNVKVFVALSGAAFGATPDIQVNGSSASSQARWGYWATQTITTTAGTLASNATPQGGTSSNNYSTLQVLIPDAATSVALTVFATNNSADEIWNVDNIAVVAPVDPATNLTFSTASLSAGEAAGSVTVTVFKTLASGNVSAQIALGGSATGGGTDYSVDTTNLVLNGATTSATIVVSLANDAVVESAETVILALTNVVGGGLVAPATLTLTIVDNDLSPNAVSNVWINEVSYDPVGADTNEFVELAGVAGTDLSTCSLVFYDGSGGLSYATSSLSGTIPDAGCGFGAVAFAFTNLLQNGAPDGLALLQGGAVVQFLSYEGGFTAANGPAAGLTATANIGDAGNNGTNTLQLAGTGTNYAGYAWATNMPSPGLLNFNQHIANCADLAISPVAASVGESVGTTDALVFKSIAASNVTAQIVMSGTATPGADFTLSTTNIVLSGATTSQVVTVTVIDDLALESDETVILTLTNLSQAVLGLPSSFTLTITANDTLALAATSAALYAQSAAAVAVAGTANNVIVGELAWSNQLTGASGTAPAATNWIIAAVPLAVGLNPISVLGSNSFGNATSIVHVITRLDLPRAGPVVIAAQGFESGDAWGIVQGAPQVATNTGALEFPPDQRLFSGTQSWQVANGSVTLELAQVSMAGYTGRQVNVRLSSTSLTVGNGADETDLVLCYAALDGAAFAAETNYTLSVAGLNNARWGFWATNSAAMGMGAQARVVAPQGGQSSNNYSDLYLLLPDAATSVAFKVWARNDSTNEIWSVDAIRLTGYVAAGDGDQLPDGWELDNFGTTTNEPAGDHDGDGFSNLDEYIAGTHPTNGAAFLKLTAISNATGTTVFFLGVTGRLYEVDYNDTLLDGAAWIQVTNNMLGTNGLMRVTQGSVSNNRAYRTSVHLP